MYKHTKFEACIFIRSEDIDECPNLENWSRDPNHAPFRGRFLCVVQYLLMSTIVPSLNSVYRSVVELYDVEIYVRSHSRSLEMTPFDRSHTSSYWRSIVTMALSCIISQIKQDWSKIAIFPYTPSAFEF